MREEREEGRKMNLMETLSLEEAPHRETCIPGLSSCLSGRTEATMHVEARC